MGEGGIGYIGIVYFASDPLFLVLGAFMFSLAGGYDLSEHHIQ